MLEQLKKEKQEKDAKAKGVPIEIYRELQDQKEELAKIKKDRESEITKSKVNVLIKSLDDFSKSYNLTKEDKEELFTKLENDGFDLDKLLNLRNHTNLFKGYMEDKIKERAKQKLLDEAARKKKLEEKKMQTQTGKAEAADLDAFLEKMIAERYKNKY